MATNKTDVSVVDIEVFSTYVSLVEEIANADEVIVTVRRSSGGKSSLHTIDKVFSAIRGAWMDDPGFDVYIESHPAE